MSSTILLDGIKDGDVVTTVYCGADVKFYAVGDSFEYTDSDGKECVGATFREGHESGQVHQFKTRKIDVMRARRFRLLARKSQ